MRKKITGILLLFVLIAPVAVTFTWLKIEKAHVKKTVKRKLMHSVDKSELVLLKFTDPQTQSELRWEHSKEFEYRQSMYDIVEREIHGDTLYFWCWLDDDETQLNKQIAALLSNVWEDDENKKEHEQRLLKYYKSLFIEKNNTSKMAYRLKLQVDFADYYWAIKSQIGQPPTPPPQI